jgi:hypothetical protein
MEKLGKQKVEVVDGEAAVKAIDDMNVKELKAELAKKGISSPASANKASLAELLKGSEGLGGGEGGGEGGDDDNGEGGDAGDDGGNDDLG